MSDVMKKYIKEATINYLENYDRLDENVITAKALKDIERSGDLDKMKEKALELIGKSKTDARKKVSLQQDIKTARTKDYLLKILWNVLLSGEKLGSLTAYAKKKQNEERDITENLDEVKEMSYTEVQIAYDNAKRIMEMMDEGIEPESWNYSKITQAADYLTSVYTAMRAKRSDMGGDYDSYYEETNLTEARKILGKYQDYHIERTKEKEVTEKHPNGAPVYALFHNDSEIGKIVPYSGTIDKKKPGSKIVSSRKYATLYRIEFNRENEVPSNILSVKSRHGHKAPKHALDSAALGHYRWKEKNEETEEANLEEKTLLGPKGSIHRAASANQSDKEYILQRQFKNKWKKENPGKEWPGYEKAGFKSSFDMKESKVDEFRTKLIHRAVTEYADGKKDIRGVSLDKIAAAFASKKNFGNKSKDDLEDELGLPIGVIIKLVKAIQSELKANMSGSTKSQTQAQRIDKYLKQKWIK